MIYYKYNSEYSASMVMLDYRTFYFSYLIFHYTCRCFNLKKTIIDCKDDAIVIFYNLHLFVPFPAPLNTTQAHQKQNQKRHTHGKSRNSAPNSLIKPAYHQTNRN